MTEAPAWPPKEVPEIQPLTAENLQKWTDAHHEIKEELHLAFLMRYVREQSLLAAAIPRPSQNLTQKEVTPAKPEKENELQEIISSTEKPSKKNLVGGMRKKDGSTPGGSTPHVNKQERSSAKKAAKEEKETAKAKRKASPPQSISSASDGDEKKHRRRSTEPPAKSRKQKDPVSLDLQFEKTKLGKRRNSKNEKQESDTSESEDDDVAAHRQKKRRQSAKSAPPKATAKKRGKEDRFQSRLISSGSRLTIKKPGRKAGDEDESDEGEREEAVQSIVNKLGIFNKGKASARAAVNGPTLTFNENRFLAQDLGKNVRSTSQEPEKSVAVKKATEIEEEIPKISEYSRFFSKPAKKTKEPEPLAEENDDNGFMLEDFDLPEPTPAPAKPKEVARPKVVAKAPEATEIGVAMPEAEPRRVADDQEPLGIEEPVIETANLRDRLRKEKKADAENVPPSNRKEKREPLKVIEPKAVSSKPTYDPLRRSRLNVVTTEPEIEEQQMGNFDDLYQEIQERNEPPNPVRYQPQDNSQFYEDENGDWVEVFQDGMVFNGVDGYQFVAEDADAPYLQQDEWVPEYPTYRDERAPLDYEDVPFDDEQQRQQGDHQGLEEELFEFEETSYPPAFAEDRYPEEEFAAQTAWPTNNNNNNNWEQRSRSASASLETSSSRFLSQLPWKANKPSVARQSLGKAGTPLSAPRASWRSVMSSLSNRAPTESPPRSLAPFTRPNYLG